MCDTFLEVVQHHVAAGTTEVRSSFFVQARSGFLGGFEAAIRGWAIRCRLEPFKKLAKTLKAHLDGVARHA
jgi:hypothetical protein